MKNIIDLICSAMLITFALALVFFNFSKFPFEVMAAEQIRYIDADGETIKTAVNCKRIENNTKKLTAGWYYVQGNVTVNTRISVSGNVCLILTDDCLLKAVNGGIDVTEGNSLTIYCQEKGTGKIEAKGGSLQSGIGSTLFMYSGDITVNGGIIEAKRGPDTAIVYIADIGDVVGNNDILHYNGGTVNGVNYDRMPEGYRLVDKTSANTCFLGESLTLSAAVENAAGNNFVRYVNYRWYDENGTGIYEQNSNMGSSIDITPEQSGEYHYKIKADFGHWSKTLTVTVYVISPSYIITVPSRITAGDDITVNAQNINIPSGKSLCVRITSDDHDENGFMLCSESGDKLRYSISGSGVTVASGDTILTASSDEHTAETILNTGISERCKYSDMYSGTLTFTAAVE